MSHHLPLTFNTTPLASHFQRHTPVPSHQECHYLPLTPPIVILLASHIQHHTICLWHPTLHQFPSHLTSHRFTLTSNITQLYPHIQHHSTCFSDCNATPTCLWHPTSHHLPLTFNISPLTLTFNVTPLSLTSNVTPHYPHIQRHTTQYQRHTTCFALSLKLLPNTTILYLEANIAVTPTLQCMGNLLNLHSLYYIPLCWSEIAPAGRLVTVGCSTVTDYHYGSQHKLMHTDVIDDTWQTKVNRWVQRTYDSFVGTRMPGGGRHWIVRHLRHFLPVNLLI